VGATRLIRRRYLDVAAGQIHLTEAGAADAPALVLLPWFPLSARMYLDELPVLAELGFRALAIDPMGQGRSGTRTPGWTVEQHADAIGEAIAQLAPRALAVLGGHMSAPIAVELAHRRSLDIVALAIDGAPLMSPEAVAAIQRRVRQPAADPLTPAALFDRAVAALSVFDPAFALDQSTLPRVHRLMLDMLDAGVPSASDMPPAYPFGERAAALTRPVLALTAETDPLRSAHEPLLGLLQRGVDHVFPGAHPLQRPDQAGQYVRVIARWLETI
jgi:pimeloyl-ACP methyl ester carboxylesterase